MAQINPASRLALLAVFAVFCSELSASHISISAQTLAADGSANERTAKRWLIRRSFFAVLVKKVGSRDEVLMPATISQLTQFCQYHNSPSA
jgi:hypothetical protein